MSCVLVVEDDHDVREMMQHFVTIAGHECMSAANGREALQLMRRRRPCLVLLDIHMPVMDGFEFRKHQIEDPELASVPVLCLSAVYDTAAVARRLDLRCLSKPVDLTDVSNEITAYCGGSH